MEDSLPVAFEDILHTLLASPVLHASSLHLLDCDGNPGQVVYQHRIPVAAGSSSESLALSSSTPVSTAGTVPVSLEILRTGILSCVRRRLQQAISAAWTSGPNGSASAPRSASNSNGPSENTTPQKLQQHQRDTILPAGIFQPLASSAKTHTSTDSHQVCLTSRLPARVFMQGRRQHGMGRCSSIAMWLRLLCWTC